MGITDHITAKLAMTAIILLLLNCNYDQASSSYTCIWNGFA